jgi:hypothetical protein
MISFPSSMSGNSVVMVIALGPAFKVEPAMGDVATNVLACAAGANKKVMSAAVANIALRLLFTLCLLAH